MIRRIISPGSLILHTVTAIMLLFVLAPLVLVVTMSFSDTYFVSFPPHGFTFRWYSQVLNDRDFLSALQLSLGLAAGSTVGSMILGVPAAIALARGHFPGRALLQGLVLSPIIFPGLVAGLALLQVLNQVDSNDARLNMLIGYIVLAAPFVIRAVVTSLLLVDANLEDAARTLGAGRIRTFRRITLPQIAPGVAGGAIFAFMTSFDNYPMSMWLANSQYNPMPTMLMGQLSAVFDPSIAAMSTVIIVVSVIGAMLIEALVGLRRAAAS